ncbi:hypothetical protein KUTeg_008428 [Tegillarca granosa]|uniref:Uncharacterized protein n=1 Tax=Tegillarca granosa TaxID=220873 RepID=A0ABQ9F944_TEGGR|nr:hypothetical protein KUTeg_008428 [Tegillarca granosa]
MTMDFTRMPVPHGFPQHMPSGDMGRPENMMNPNMLQQEHFSQVEGLYTGGATSTDADYREIHSVLVDQGDRFGVSTVCFDDRQELLWMGNQGVY